MDITVFSSVTIYLMFFWVGYIVFLKLILPIIALEMKLKNKLILSQMLWFKKNLHRINFFRLPHTRLMRRTRNLMKSAEILTEERKIFFGLYPMDIFIIRLACANLERNPSLDS